jgi:hypothetical protein
LSAYPNCPGANPAAKGWRDYFSTEIRGGEAGKAIVHFDKYRQLNDPSAIGGLNPKICYGVYYVTRTKSWSGFADRPPSPAGLPGDPLDNEINVFGVLFTFNNKGELINTKGDVVGRLVCYLSNECEGF